LLQLSCCHSGASELAACHQILLLLLLLLVLMRLRPQLVFREQGSVQTLQQQQVHG
jgi:hypothetical protein